MSLEFPLNLKLRFFKPIIPFLQTPTNHQVTIIVHARHRLQNPSRFEQIFDPRQKKRSPSCPAPVFLCASSHPPLPPIFWSQRISNWYWMLIRPNNVKKSMSLCLCSLQPPRETVPAIDLIMPSDVLSGQYLFACFGSGVCSAQSENATLGYVEGMHKQGICELCMHLLLSS